MCRVLMTFPTLHRACAQPTYDFTLSTGDPPQSSTFAFRLVSFRDLRLGLRGELELASPFPPPMSKWKRFVTLTQSDLEKIAAVLDKWMREMFDARGDWSFLVVDAVNAFLASAVDSSLAQGNRSISVAQAQPGMASQLSEGGNQRSFAAFLSHFKFECGTEARLVHIQLPRHLPAGNRDVFLDSGKWDYALAAQDNLMFRIHS